MRPLTSAKRAGNALAQLAWFTRNVATKLALAARRTRLAVTLGHDPRDGFRLE